MSESIINTFASMKNIACIQLCNGEDYIAEGSCICLATGNSFDYIAVFDGHGDSSKIFMEAIRNLPLNEIMRTSDCPATYIQKYILQNYPYFPVRPGCTFTCVKIYPDRIDLTSVGDSNAFIYINKELIYKSVDHVITNPTEIERLKNLNIKYIVEKETCCKILSPTSIEMVDNKVFRIKFIKGVYEFWLAISQSLGHKNITGIAPEKKSILFNPDDKIDIIVASDGLWDVFNPEICEEDRVLALNATAQEIANEAEKRWKQPWDLHQDGIIYKDQTFPENGYDDVSVGVWRK